MDADWITSPSARRVLQHTEDSRPAWLWSQDGQSLLWWNEAAGLFLGKLKKHGLKRAPLATPIKGQVARNIRLGSLGRTSLARIQFIAGDKPASSTCATTPLTWQDGQTALLVVGVDPIDPEIIAAAASERETDEEVALPVAEPALEPEVAAKPIEVVDLAAEAEPPVDSAPSEDGVEPTAGDDSAYQRELDNWRDAEQSPPPTTRQFVVVDEPSAESDAEPGAELHTSRLSRLVDRLAADDALYAPLSEADDAPMQAISTEATVGGLFTVTGQGFVADTNGAGEIGVEETEADADLQALGEMDGEADMLAAEPPPAETDADVSKHVERMEAALAVLTPKPAADAEAVERVSRYNFDELSRILTDKVGEAAQPANAPPPAPVSAPVQTGSLINLGGETLVLNRLPLGILVFRDQQVLFANRAITEMVGYDSVENLRAAGLAAVFPAAGPEGQGAGPVNHLVQRDGTLVPVTARLQSISWQGRPALMLSASATEVRTGHEAAVRAFAQTFAAVRGDGYFDMTRAGVISAISPKAVALLGENRPLEGTPLLGMTASGEAPALREFLERPARFAETARPCMTLRSSSGKAEIILFAQGQAGVVTGYFGFVRGRDIVPARLSAPAEADPALLARISRGVRRPLNTIIGFSDLIRSKAFGELADERYESYAEDITTAGQEIAALVDELDDYARLRDGRYLPQRASIDLTGLLESCVVRIRQQASSARVIVRNAISENLPRVTADRASLAQAVLNLMASAIDQTPTGGAVVISAQIEDDGGIAVHVRDSSPNTIDMGERFVVFRDGVGRDGTAMTPVRSSVGLALTRSLLAVNAFSLSMDPAGEQGMLFTLLIPADLVEKTATPDVAE